MNSSLSSRFSFEELLSDKAAPDILSCTELIKIKRQREKKKRKCWCLGDVNHSPVSVLASKQLRTDRKPNRDCNISFLIGWAGSVSTTEPSVSCSNANAPTQSQVGQRDEQASPQGRDPAPRSPALRVRKQRKAHFSEAGLVSRDKEQDRVELALYFHILISLLLGGQALPSLNNLMSCL